MHENKNIFLKKTFWRKTGILIPDLYFYDIKIQTNIKQNLVKKYAEKSQIFLIFFLFFFLDWAGPGPLILGWIPLLHEQWMWIIIHARYSRIAGEKKKKKKGGGRLTCDGGGLAGVKGNVVPAVVADGGWGGGLSSSPLCFAVLFSSSVFCSLCQQGFFPLCSGCVASLLFTVDHSGGGEARRQLLRFFLVPRVLPLSTTSSSLCFIPSPTLWFCWRWQRWCWWNGGARWWWPKATVEREEQLLGTRKGWFFSNFGPKNPPSVSASFSPPRSLLLLSPSLPFSSVLAELLWSKKQNPPLCVLFVCKPLCLLSQIIPPFSIFFSSSLSGSVRFSPLSLTFVLHLPTPLSFFFSSPSIYKQEERELPPALSHRGAGGSGATLPL